MDTQKTIRDEITRKSVSQRWLAVAPAVGMGVIGLFVAAMRSRAFHTHPHGLVMLLPAGLMLLLALAGLIIVSRRASSLQCPKCSSPLSVFGYLMKDTPRMKKINFCPWCGVNLDSPMPEAPAENVTTPDKLVWK
jgi:hypothetical protein